MNSLICHNVPYSTIGCELITVCLLAAEFDEDIRNVYMVY